MTRTERKLLVTNLLVGTGLTLVVVFLSWGGKLNALERWFYDRRIRWCQLYMPPPTDKLVHLDINDETLSAIGPWPWKRTYLADLLDELRIAGAKAVAMDIVFPEAQEQESKLRPDGTIETIDHDANLAAAIKRFGPVLVPMFSTIEAVEGSRDQNRILSYAAKAFEENLEIENEQELREILKSKFQVKPEDVDKYVTADKFVVIRREVMYERVLGVLKAAGSGWESITFADLRAKLLPSINPIITSSAELRTLQEQFNRAQAVMLLSRFASPMPSGVPPLLPIRVLPPVTRLSRAAGLSGFVDHLSDSDGVARSVALWENSDGRLYPQMGLSMACFMLGVDTKQLILREDEVVIPKLDGTEIVLPVHTRAIDQLNGRHVGMFMDVPWWGKHEGWQTMYDYPEYQEPLRHLPVVRVWDSVQTDRRLRSTLVDIDHGLRAIYALTEPGLAEEMLADPFPTDHLGSRPEKVAEALEMAESVKEFIVEMTPQDIEEQVKFLVDKERAEKQELIDNFLKMSDEERQAYAASVGEEARKQLEELANGGLDPYIRHFERDQRNSYVSFMPAVTTLSAQLEAVKTLEKDLARSRGELSAWLGGKAVLIGWTATAAAADFVPTPLHSKCPGPIVHGVVFNAVMTGEAWRSMPVWLNLVIIAVIGIAATVIVAILSPFRALGASLVLAGGYAVVNGLLLFDYGNIILGLAGPTISTGLVWSSCTVIRFYVERRERRRIENRFRGYVDTALVDYVLENPERTFLEGEEREMSVVFTDLAGFTTLSEKLREKVVPLLNDYMNVMVPVIKNHNGFVNKFLGDGIMFFYGAPKPNPDHAMNALVTVLRMYPVVDEFNAQLKQKDLPMISLRCGVATGPMVVGDAGGVNRSDYTVLGDTVNLSARLESANKATGTKILCTERTIELAGDAILARPVARLTVKGKSIGMLVFEPVAVASEATDEDRRLVALTKPIVTLFSARDFKGCLAALEEYEKAYGEGKFTHMYRDQAEEYLVNPPPPDWDGSTVLKDK